MSYVVSGLVPIGRLVAFGHRSGLFVFKKMEFLHANEKRAQLAPRWGRFFGPSPLITSTTKSLLWPRPLELLRWYRMECRRSWRALASTRGSSRLDNGFPDVRYRPRHPGSWIPTKGSNFDHAGGFEEPWNSPFADRCIADPGFLCRAWLPPQFGALSSPASHPPHRLTLNSLATSLAHLRIHRSAIVAWFVF